MKKLTAYAVMLAVALSVLWGCSKKPEETTKPDSSVIGSWTETFFDSGYTFNEDGTGTDTFWDLTFTYTAGGGTIVITYDSDLYGIATYSYSVSGNTLSMTRQGEDDAQTYTYTKRTAERTQPAAGTEETTEAGSDEETSQE